MLNNETIKQRKTSNTRTLINNINKRKKTTYLTNNNIHGHSTTLSTKKKKKKSYETSGKDNRKNCNINIHYLTTYLHVLLFSSFYFNFIVSFHFTNVK